MDTPITPCPQCGKDLYLLHLPRQHLDIEALYCVKCREIRHAYVSSLPVFRTHAFTGETTYTLNHSGALPAFLNLKGELI